ncbi:MAG TPA: 4Fe-4S single cluster domain-containing protein [Armatimonadota bacterium]|jgi:anaerobic ribonucleoside-triphosphate reductase activating protein
MLLDDAGYAFPVEGLGPGRRIALWVRGCARRCPGCIAPELWHAGTPRDITQVADELLPFLVQADGLTISGGEPFEQAESLAALLDLLRAESDIEALIYTGYRREELEARNDACADLLARTDLLIDSPFHEAEANTLQWRGSDNQRVHLLTERAQRHLPAINAPMPEARPLQVQMLTPLRFRIIGIPRRGDLAAYRQALAARGLEVAPDE